MTVGRYLVEWMADAEFHKWAARVTAAATGWSYDDAADAVQEACMLAWRRRVRRFETATDAVIWVARAARRVHTVSDADPEIGQWRPSPPDIAVDAAAIAGRADAVSDDELRADGAIACLAGIATLQDIGEDLDLTRERVRQIRDELAENLTRWATREPAPPPPTIVRPPFPRRVRHSRNPPELALPFDQGLTP